MTVPLLSSQLSPNDRLWRLYSALQQCRNLLERAIGLEEGVGNDGDRVQYESQKKTVRDRLGHLLASTRLLLEDGAGTAAFTPDPKNTEVQNYWCIVKLPLDTNLGSVFNFPHKSLRLRCSTYWKPSVNPAGLISVLEYL